MSRRAEKSATYPGSFHRAVSSRLPHQYARGPDASDRTSFILGGPSLRNPHIDLRPPLLQSVRPVLAESPGVHRQPRSSSVNPRTFPAATPAPAIALCTAQIQPACASGRSPARVVTPYPCRAVFMRLRPCAAPAQKRPHSAPFSVIALDYRLPTSRTIRRKITAGCSASNSRRFNAIRPIATPAFISAQPGPNARPFAILKRHAG